MSVVKVSFVKYFFALILISVSFFSVAQKISGAYKLYEVSDGIIENNINDLTIDDNEICWLANQHGISRFDNFNFINFSSKTDSIFFKDDNVDQLYKANHFIYLISNTNGLIKLNPINFKLYKLFNEGLLSLAIKGDSSVYLFTTGKLQFRIKDKIISECNFGDQEKGSVVFFNNKIYLKLLDPYLLELNPSNLKVSHKIKVEKMGLNGKLLLSSINGLVYHSGKSVYVIDKKRNVQFHPILNDVKNITFYNEGNRGEYNYISNNKVPYLSKKNRFFAIIFDNSLNARANNIYKLSDNCAYIGTNQGLIKAIFKYNISSPLNDYSFFSVDFLRLREGIVKGNDSDFYLMGFPGILNYRNNKTELFSSDDIKTNNGVLIKSNLYCATEGDGLVSYSIKNKKKEQIITPHILKNDTFCNVSRYHESEILLAGHEKIVAYNLQNKNSRIYNLTKGTEVYKITEDINSGCLHLATNKGMLRIKLGTKDNFLTVLPTKFKFDKKINDLLIIAERNEIWLATDLGIYVLDRTNLNLIREYNYPLELSSPKVSALIYNDNKIWASTFSGITSIDLIKNKVNFISKYHGLINSEYTFRSAAWLNDSNIVFGGLNGYDILETNSLDSIRYESSFFISAVEIIGNKNSISYSIRKSLKDFNFSFNTGEEDLYLYLANKDKLRSSEYKFEYQINNDNWISLKDKKVIKLSNLEYGDYKINIRMVDSFGHVSKTKTYQISAFLPFYKRTSMVVYRWLLLFILIIVIIYFYFKSIKVENETKSRIAMNLHDEAGTILTRLSLLVQSSKKLDDDKEKINSGINEVLYSLRTFISSMTKSIFTIQELEDELREFITKTFKDSLVNYDFKLIYDENYNLSGELYRDLKLCVYEAVTNSIKHSKCDKFAFSIMAEKKVIELRMVDNGLLTNLSQLTMKGNGIRNIKKRVARNKGEVLFTISEEQKGLALNLKFPIK
jgi:two-component sensor histidine kinase